MGGHGRPRWPSVAPRQKRGYDPMPHHVAPEGLGLVARKPLVPRAGLEPARLAAAEFKSAASTVPPPGHRRGGRVFQAHRVGDMWCRWVPASREKKVVVPRAGLEPALREEAVFETAASTVPPPGHGCRRGSCGLWPQAAMFDGAHRRTRTGTPCGTATSTLRVYQFRQVGVGALGAWSRDEVLAGEDKPFSRKIIPRDAACSPRWARPGCCAGRRPRRGRARHGPPARCRKPR